MNNSIETTTHIGKELPSGTLQELFALFDNSYDRANHDYLVASFDTMRWIALARHREKLVGLAVGDARRVKLPRLDSPQSVAMAGLACIDDQYRRDGLFGQLAIASMAASGELDPNQRFLFCGRMAHSISYRTMARSSNNAVPKVNQEMSDWHQEVMLRLAELYGVKVEPSTGRVIGKGQPIGYPHLEYQSSNEEEQLFATVNRDNGDSLLAMSWNPDAPDDWLA